MARRRRVLSTHIYVFVFLASDLARYQERTSCVKSIFAQSCRRWFTESLLGVSLHVSDADLFSVFHRRTVSLLPSVFVGFSEAADLLINGKCFVLVAGNFGSSQIRRARAHISAFLLGSDVRNPFIAYHRRFISVVPCFSEAPHPLLSTSAKSWWLKIGSCSPDPVTISSISRMSPTSHATEQTLVYQILGQYWALQILGQVLAPCLLGLMVEKPLSVAPSTPRSIFSRSFRDCLRPPLTILLCLSRQIFAAQDCFPEFELGWCFGPVFFNGYPLLNSRNIVKTTLLLHWRLSAKLFFHLGLCYSPRYQNSFCRGSFLPSSFSKERSFSQLFYHCHCVAWSALICVGCSEALPSVFFKGTANRCSSAYVFAAEVRIASSALVADPSLNNRSQLVLIVPHGSSLLLVFNLIKVQGRRDDDYCSNVRIACIYPCFFRDYAICLALVVEMFVALMARICLCNLCLLGWR